MPIDAVGEPVEQERAEPHSGVPGTVVLQISLIELLTQIARRKRLIGLSVAAGLLTGIVLCFVLPVRYTATTRILTPQQAPPAIALLTSSSAGGAGGLAAFAGQGLSLKNPNDIYVGMLKSRPVADAVIRKFSLVAEYGAKDMTAARRKLAMRTSVESEKDGMIAIAVTDSDRNRAAEMANAYTDELGSLTSRIAVTEASRRRLFYEGQLKIAGAALVEAEARLQQVQQKKGVVQPDAQAAALVEALALLHAQIAAKQVELHALETYSTERNPDVELTRQELSSLREQAANMEQRGRAPGFRDFTLGDLPAAGMDFLRAEHDAQYRRAIYDLLMKQYDAARLDEAKEAAVIQVVERAIPPDRKSSPRRILIMLVALAGGLFGGCCLALLSWWGELVRSDPSREEQLRKLSEALFGGPQF